MGVCRRLGLPPPPQPIQHNLRPRPAASIRSASPAPPAQGPRRRTDPACDNPKHPQWSEGLTRLWYCSLLMAGLCQCEEGWIPSPYFEGTYTDREPEMRLAACKLEWSRCTSTVTKKGKLRSRQEFLQYERNPSSPQE